MKTKIIKLDDIVIDAGTQQRERINPEVVAEYAEEMKCGIKFPAITIFFNGAQHFLVDGFHRYWAYKEIKETNIEADVHEGNNDDAIIYSCGVNTNHGLRLSNADKRNAVTTLINHPKTSSWSDNKIAKHCKVTQPFVSKIRKEVITVITPKEDAVNKNESGNVSKNSLKPALNLETEEKLSTGAEEEFDENEFKSLQLSGSINALNEENDELKAENQSLRDALAINQIPNEIELKSAELIISDLRKQVAALEAEIASTRATRDRLMLTNSQLEKQCAYLQNKLKKAGIK